MLSSYGSLTSLFLTIIWVDGPTFLESDGLLGGRDVSLENGAVQDPFLVQNARVQVQTGCIVPCVHSPCAGTKRTTHPV